MEADIRAAKAENDVVFVAQHWGIHFVRAQIADYETDVARAAIAAGADAVIGGHPHVIKGCQVIDGKPVFHSLCNFATDLGMDEAHAKSKSWNEIRVLAERWEPDFEGPYNFPDESRLAMVARFVIAGGKVQRAGFLPLHIGRDAIPRFVTPDQPEHAAVLAYLREVTAEAGLNANYIEGDDMIAIEASA